MSPQIQTTGELREALTQKLNELKESLGADVVTLHLYDPQRDRLYFPVSAGLLHQAERFTRSMPAMERVAGKIVRSQKPIIAGDAEHHPDMTGPFTHAERVKTAAAFPLLVPDLGEVVGVLFVNYRHAHRFEEGETEQIESSASGLAAFISRSLQGDQGRMLRDALRMEADLRLEELRLFEILGQLWEVLGDADVVLWTRKRGERELRVRAHAGLDPDFAARVFVNPDADRYNLVSVALVDQKEVLIESPKDAPEATFNVAAPIAWQHMLAVPVSSEYHRLGVLCAFRRERPGFTRREHDLVRAFANLIAVTIESEDRIIALNALHDVGVRLTFVTDLSEILEEVVRSAWQVMGADVATVHLYDPARQEFHGLERAAVFPREARPDMEKPRGKGGLSARIIEEGRVYCEDVDTQASPTTLSTFIRKQGIKAYVGTPLISIDEPLGVLYVSFKEKRRFSPDDLALVQILANYASTAVYRAELLDQRTAVTEIARDIASELDRDVLLQGILERSLKLLDCEVGSIALWNKATGELEYHYAIGKEVGMRLPVGQGLMTAAAQTRRPVRVGDVTKDPRYVEHVAETRSELDVPLSVGDELIGVLNAESPRYNAFSEEDERLAMTLASQAAVALYNASLFQQRSALVDFGRVVASGMYLREEEVLELIYRQASELMDTDNMYIALYDEAINTVRFGLAMVDGRRVDFTREKGWQPRKAGKGLTEEIIRTESPILISTKAEAEAWYAQPEHEEYIGTISSSWLGVPMMVGEKVLGVIATYHPTRDYVYSSDELEILQAVANQAAVALDNARLFYDVNLRLEALVEFGRVVTSGIRLREDKVLELIYSQASKLMDTDNMYVAMYDEATDTVRFGLMVVEGSPIDVQPRKAGKGRTEEIIRTKKPILISTKAEAEAWYDTPGREDYLSREMLPSWLGVPMMGGEKVLGVIATYHPTREYVYSGDDLESLLAMASQAAIALDNAALYRQNARRVTQLETVREIANAIQTHVELPAFLQSILELSLPRLGAQMGTIQLLDKATNELVVRANVGLVVAREYARIPLGRGVTGQAAREKHPVYVPDTSQSEIYLPYLGETRSELAVPLVYGDEVIGVFNTEDPRLDAFDDEVQELCKLIADQVAIAILQKLQLEEEQDKRLRAEKDALLGKLTRDIAHHVKNKVGLVRLAAINLLNDPIVADSPSRCKEVDKILRNAESAAKLARDLFEPYRETESELVDVNWLLEEALNLVGEQEGIKVTKVLAPDLPPVFIERQGAVNVFQELLLNGLRAVRRRKGPRWIEVSSRLSDDQQYIELLFSNSGPPIPREQWETIFEQFAALERFPGEEGFGLGLWSARAFLRRQGGDVRVLGSDEIKTTFVAQLPA